MTDQTNQHAGDLYRLAFLLTGDREASVTATIEALDRENDTLARSRRAVITKAITAIRDDLAASPRKRRGSIGGGCREAGLDRGKTKVEVERAARHRCVPRCAVVLSVFEGFRRKMSRFSWMQIGLWCGGPGHGPVELTRNLARAQGASPFQPVRA
jgi:hypothetical protein